MRETERRDTATTAVADAILKLVNAHAHAVECRDALAQHAQELTWSELERRQWACALASIHDATQHLALATQHLSRLAVVETYSQDWGV